MNSRLRNELSLLAVGAAMLMFHKRRDKTAAGLAALALGLKFLPTLKPFNYKSKHVVITGGSRGLGFALAQQLLKQGARVTLLARNPEELADALLKLNGEVTAYVCDVTHTEELAQALLNSMNCFGRIDMMINNAGSIVAAPFETMEVEEFEAQMALHLGAALDAARILIPHFKAAGGGRIVNISSIGGKIALPHMSAYSASKFALAGFSRSLAAEVGEYGIHVTTVYPGLMRTGSPIQAVFKGDHEKEFAWFAAMDLAPGVSVSAEHAAKKILEGAARGDVEVIVSLPAKLGAFVYEMFPELSGLAFKLASRFLPHGQSTERKVGAAAYTWFAQQFWARPLWKVENRVARKFNQLPRTDAEFNLGLPETH